MKERVLVVDDAREIRNFLAEYILKPRGFDVLTASNGLEGLALAVSKKPDLLILDIRMPRLNGLELLQRLRDRGLEMPTILMTAHGSEEIAVKAFRLGIRDYVIKPFDVEEMDAAIDRALRESRLWREHEELTSRLAESNTQLKRHLQEFNILFNIGRSVTSTLDLQEVLGRVVEAAVYVTSAEEGTLLLRDSQTAQWTVQAVRVAAGSKQSPQMPALQALNTISHSRKPLLLTPESGAPQPPGEAPPPTYAAYVPLIAQDNPIGALVVANRTRAISFTGRDTRVLSALADYAAVAYSGAHNGGSARGSGGPFADLVRSSHDPMLLIDASGRITLYNQAARRALDLPEGQLIGLPAAQMITAPALRHFLEQEPLADGSLPTMEYEDSHGHAYLAHLSPVKELGRSLILHDITHLKLAKQLNNEAVVSVSQDVRSPLTSILAYADLLHQAGPLNQEQLDFLSRIEQSVRQITELISRMLELEQIDPGLPLNRTLCHVDALITAAIEQLQPALQERNLSMRSEIGPDLPPVLGDRSSLEQALYCLLEHAARLSPPGATLRLGAQSQEGQVIIKLGCPPSGAAGEETGPGLAYARRTAEQHHGRLWLGRDPDAGTTLALVLPAHEAPRQADIPPGQRPPTLPQKPESNQA